ncbi:fasciclin [Leptolyngbya sp. BL0902]|uniref:fasciclin domain-containing protein n=1 Tax=Leptolyngbya sp. BL0902 TaxID=1115757 RepID=UPI0018E7CBFB|nr:fasciclin domain-containing protein [Leptolyngbya sp. BL0902]QQE66439.1 fasciclin [Leptolyngbya sp. BL0902]
MTTLSFSSLKRLTIGVIGVGALSLMAACGSSADMTTDATVSDEAPMAAEGSDYGATAGNTVVDIAASEDDFTILVQAIEAAELTETLASSTPITVFAPTNAAFEALPEGALEALLQPENQDALRQVLSYHVLPLEVPAAEVTTGEVPTAAGAPLTLVVDEATGTVMVNNAQVIMTDIMASNGIIHAIDQVVLPPDLSL